MVLKAVADKRGAEGTDMEAQRMAVCSRLVKQEYGKWVSGKQGLVATGATAPDAGTENQQHPSSEKAGWHVDPRQ